MVDEKESEIERKVCFDFGGFMRSYLCLVGEKLQESDRIFFLFNLILKNFIIRMSFYF